MTRYMLILVLGLQPETSQRWKQILLMVTVKMQVMLTFDSCRFPTAYQMATAYERNYDKERGGLSHSGSIL